MTNPSSLPSFLFVCTGNICRSPLAELAMRQQAEQHGLQLLVDSAGLGDWHVGDPPDSRACATARRHGLNADMLHARQVRKDDFERFSHIIALDNSHLKALKRMKPAGSTTKILLLLDAVKGRQGQDVVDPYYGPAEGFETTWQDVEAGCKALAQRFLDGLSSS